jgi:DNA-binding response OmpR family regulator
MSSNLPNLIIIEDNAWMQEILTQYLSQFYNVKLCNDGLEAITLLQSGFMADIIVSDLNVPKLSGLELIKQLKTGSFFSAVPIIILSGDETADARVKCLEAGADDYITKPFNPKELELRLKVVLRRSGKF